MFNLNTILQVASYRWLNGKNSLLGHVIIPVEKHLECKCACVVKKEVCFILHVLLKCL